MLMDIHKQVIEKISASKIRKQREAPCLHTIAYLTFIYTSFRLHVFWILQITRCLKSFLWDALIYGSIIAFYLNLAK